MKWGIDSYSLFLHLGKHRFQPSQPKSVEWLFETAQALECPVIQLDALHHGNELQDAVAARELGERYGIGLEWSTGGFTPDQVEHQLRLSKAADAPLLRTFIAGQRPTAEQLAEWIPLAKTWFAQVAPIADELDVDLVLENHADLTISETLEIVTAVNHPRFGVCLDLTNNCLFDEDPMDCVKTLAPHTKNVHFKDGIIGPGTITNTALGEGELPLREILQILKAQCPSASLMLEIPCPVLGNEQETLENEMRAVKQSCEYMKTLLEEMDEEIFGLADGHTDSGHCPQRGATGKPRV